MIFIKSDVSKTGACIRNRSKHEASLRMRFSVWFSSPSSIKSFGEASDVGKEDKWVDKVDCSQALSIPNCVVMSSHIGPIPFNPHISSPGGTGDEMQGWVGTDGRIAGSKDAKDPGMNSFASAFRFKAGIFQIFSWLKVSLASICLLFGNLGFSGVSTLPLSAPFCLPCFASRGVCISSCKRERERCKKKRKNRLHPRRPHVHCKVCVHVCDYTSSWCWQLLVHLKWEQHEPQATFFHLIATSNRLISHHAAEGTSCVAGAEKNTEHITPLKSHHEQCFLQ